ncbi:MAG: glycosyltransferase family 2 protein [Pseudomonadota bacterium]|nr:glycosyltransferase family 2 protein [Pseudomonadota bacterium]
MNFFLARGRMLAARNRRILKALPGMRKLVHVLQRREYARWSRRVEPGSAELEAMRAEAVRIGASAPRVSILMPVFNTQHAHLEAAIESVRAQAWLHWQLCICNDGSSDPEIRAMLDAWAQRDSRIRVCHLPQNQGIGLATKAALALADSPFIGFLDHDDCLAPWALYFVARTLLARPQLDVLYSDEDKLDLAGQRYSPHFKPDWNPELFHGANYLCHFVVLRRIVLDAAGGPRGGYDGAQDFDLLMRCVAQTTAERIVHVPAVLYHWRESETSTARSIDAKPYAHAAGLAALKALQGEGAVEVGDGPFPVSYRVRHPLSADAPLVSILIPTRDGLEQLRRCIDSIVGISTYRAFELLVLDNQSSDPQMLAYLAELAAQPYVRVLRYDHAFNYSAINNFGAEHARGEVLLLLNDDVEVRNSDWLEEMLGQLLRPGIGVVGAKLYYPNGRIQHAGVILGIGGVAAHGHKHFIGSDFGYFGRLSLTQAVSAVTGACLMVRRRDYQRLQGLDATELPIAYSDIDFCLRLSELGLRCVWTPYAELTHHESLSRGRDYTPEKRQRLAREARVMRGRWGAKLDSDPAYNPNLTLDREDFSLADQPESYLDRLNRLT